MRERPSNIPGRLPLLSADKVRWARQTSGPVALIAGALGLTESAVRQIRQFQTYKWVR